MKKGRVGAYTRFMLGLAPYLRHALSLERARALIQARLRQRERSFLQLVERAIYAQSRSPYLALLKAAGCELGDIRAGLRTWGLEGLLARLHAAGVWVPFDAFKGRAPLKCGGDTLGVRTADFNNPMLRAGYQASSGGSSGRAVRTQMDLDFLTGRAAYDAVMFQLLDKPGAPLGLWYPSLPANTGMGNSLRYHRIGRTPSAWFELQVARETKPSLESRLATEVVLAASRAVGRPLPTPVAAGVEQIDTVLDWIVAALRRSGECLFQSYVSQAVRLSHVASERGIDLHGLCFIVGSEPLTAAKASEIRGSGAEVYPRYFATEVGPVAMGCGAATAVGDYHLLGDSLTAVQPGGEGAALHFTSLLPDCPTVLLNVQLGDVGRLEQRACHCDFGQLGLNWHVSEVRSVDAVTSEGMALSWADLLRLSERLLPLRYGGSSIDYQWVEEEERDAGTRLTLRIDPRLGPLDPSQLVGQVLGALRQGTWSQRLMAEVWGKAGTIRVVRESPRRTEQGKLKPILLERGQARVGRAAARHVDDRRDA